MRLTVKAIRAQHEAGVAALNRLFGFVPDVSGLQHGRAKPVRLHPNTPPVRDAEHKRKHRLRKISNESKRGNRR